MVTHTYQDPQDPQHRYTRYRYHISNSTITGTETHAQVQIPEQLALVLGLGSLITSIILAQLYKSKYVISILRLCYYM